MHPRKTSDIQGLLSEALFTSVVRCHSSWCVRYRENDLTILSPLVLTANLLLLLRGEVVGDVECLADLLWRLSLNHVCDGLTSNIQEGLDIKVVGGLDELAPHFFGGADGGRLTRMISKSISWSTCMNFWSHSSMSVVFLRESESSSAGVAGSDL